MRIGFSAERLTQRKGITSGHENSKTDTLVRRLVACRGRDDCDRSLSNSVSSVVILCALTSQDDNEWRYQRYIDRPNHGRIINSGNSRFFAPSLRNSLRSIG